MKKTLFIGLTALIGFTANAQYKEQLLTPPTFGKATIESSPSREQFKNQHKKTRGGSIFLNYIDFMAVQENISQATLDANSFVYFCFPDSNMRYNPPNQGYGIGYKSIGQVLDPSANVISANTPSGEIFIGGNAYTVDSLFVLGSYAKVSNAVDTMIMSIVHSGGTNLPESFFTGQTADFLVDTTRFLTQLYDPINYSTGLFQTNIPGQPAAYTVKRALTGADSSAYTMGANSYGTKYMAFSANSFSVPAGEKVAVSFTFKPGYSYNPGDSMGMYNKWLFKSYEPNGLNSFMPFYPGDYNMSSIISKDTSNGWNMEYIPTLAFTNTFGAEVHDIFWKLTCTTCGPIGTNDFISENDFSVSPNPATDNLNFNFNLANSAKNVSIGMTNLVGQQVKNIDLGAVSANNTQKIDVNVTDLPTGIYIYTINVDGQKYSNKVLVK